MAEKANAKKEEKSDSEDEEFAPSKQTEKLSISESSSPASDVLGRKPTASSSGSKKSLAVKKGAVKSNFFDDFDEPEDSGEEDDDKPKEEVGRYSKFAYNENDSKKPLSSSTNGEDRYSKPEKGITPAERAQKASVGSDSFVPTRSKMAVQAEKKASQPSAKSYGSGSTSTYAQSNFSNAKSISSKQFFGDEETKGDSYNAEKREKLSRFEGAKSISSASYYDRDEEEMKSGDVDASDIARRIAYTAKNDLGQVRDIVSDSSKKLAAMASDFFSDLSERYK